MLDSYQCVLVELNEVSLSEFKENKYSEDISKFTDFSVLSSPEDTVSLFVPCLVLHVQRAELRK